MPAADMTTTEPTIAALEASLPPVDNDLDSLASQEDEDGDNLPIWIDGEEHWITGVDASTTCADLICALLSYRSLQQQQMYRKEGLSSHCPAPAVHGPQEYAIVQKQRHYEEYLDGSARLCDVIASRHALPMEEECQLQLRHLATATAASRKHTPTTDKDSGMGSPVDSSRSMRFRRRGKSKVLPATMELEQWGMTKANPKQPKRSRRVQQQQQQKSSHTSPSESLLNIILAQDETILQQMSMLHDKDRQILKIEEEKHRVRERELGKNYLLETYLKDLEETQENGHLARQSSEEGTPIRGEDAAADNGSSRTPLVDAGQAIKDEIQLYWLEKIHAVNKDLQREEELLLSLHAKVRRHQVKRVYETKSEVLVQIDKLDTQLAAQVADIHRVERKLFTANEQLKAKLGVLECLGREFETTVVAEERFVEEEPQEAVKLARLIQSSSPPADKHRAGGDQPTDLNRRCRLTQKELTDRNLNGHQRPNDKGLTKLLLKGRSGSPTCSSSNAFVPVEFLGTLV